MGELTYQQRKRLPDRAFAIDGIARKYPIPDIEHARNALARVSTFGTRQEQKIVRKAVYHTYPELAPENHRSRRLSRRMVRLSPKIPRLS